MSEQRHEWIEKTIRENVPYWKILLIQITRSTKLSERLINARIDTKQENSIHAGAKTCTVTRMYIRDVLIGEYKQFVNAEKTQPNE